MEEADSDRQRQSVASKGDCPNCGTPLRGPYCYQCGQRARDRIAPLGSVLRDLLSETFNFDTRVFRTLKPLLTQPGRLTKEYVAGRRAGYVPPLRLFVFSSFVLFLLLGLISTWTIESSQTTTADTGALPSDTTAQDVTLEVGSASPDGTPFVNMPPAARDTLTKLADSLRQQSTIVAQLKYGLIRGGLQAARDPERFIQSLIGRLSGLAFLMLPVFALMLKLFYIRTGRLYVEHLILALHSHAFLFILLIGITLLNLSDSQMLTGAAAVVTTAGPSVYLLIAMRRVYEQSWGLTLVKWCALLMVYLTVLGIAISLYMILTLMLL